MTFRAVRKLLCRLTGHQWHYVTFHSDTATVIQYCLRCPVWSDVT